LRELKSEDYPLPPPKRISKKIIIGFLSLMLFIGLITYILMSNNDSQIVQVSGPAVIAPTNTIDSSNSSANPITTVDTPKQGLEGKDNQGSRSNSGDIRSEPMVSPKGEYTNSGSPSNKQNKKSLTLQNGNIYQGETTNGIPDGLGTLYFKSKQQISSKDIKARLAEEGDYFIGEFNMGYPVQGKLFDSQNNLKEIIIIGR
jgi:hypothetical protein